MRGSSRGLGVLSNRFERDVDAVDERPAKPGLYARPHRRFYCGERLRVQRLVEVGSRPDRALSAWDLGSDGQHAGADDGNVQRYAYRDERQWLPLRRPVLRFGRT